MEWNTPPACNRLLADLYGGAHLEEALSRYRRLYSDFTAHFGHTPAGLFSAPGRTELGGNHTDHQRGRVLAAGINLDIAAAAGPNGTGVIRVCSEGFPPDEIDLDDLLPRPEEVNRSAALIRGAAERIRALGGTVEGFDAYLHSTVPGGSGLSSSAAYEVLIAGIISTLFCGGRFTPVELAQIGQYAENQYFGKPCGLMDQAASALGGVVAIDFASPDCPAVEQLPFDLTSAGYALCILDSGADHIDLTDEYAAVTREMGAVAAYFGKEVLSQVEEEAFYAHLPAIRAQTGDRAVLRARHFFSDTRCAHEEAEALRRGDLDGFLRLANQSGRSSSRYLQNVIPTGQTHHQELALTLALCEHYLQGRGASRVHGGGFAGTAQAFVPLDMLSDFQSAMEGVLGAGRCHVLTLRPVGFVRIC